MWTSCQQSIILIDDTELWVVEQRLQVSAGEKLACCCDCVEVDVIGQRHATTQCLQDLRPFTLAEATHEHNKQKLCL